MVNPTSRSSSSKKGTLREQRADAQRKAAEADRKVQQGQRSTEGYAEVDVVNVEQGSDNPVAFAQALQSSHQAHQDLELIAAAAGVDGRKLFMCIVSEIGWIGLARCLRSGSNFLECVTANVDFASLLACAGSAVTGAGFSLGDEQNQESSEPAQANEF